MFTNHKPDKKSYCNVVTAPSPSSPSQNCKHSNVYPDKSVQQQKEETIGEDQSSTEFWNNHYSYRNRPSHYTRITKHDDRIYGMHSKQNKPTDSTCKKSITMQDLLLAAASEIDTDKNNVKRGPRSSNVISNDVGNKQENNIKSDSKDNKTVYHTIGATGCLKSPTSTTTTTNHYKQSNNNKRKRLSRVKRGPKYTSMYHPHPQYTRGISDINGNMTPSHPLLNRKFQDIYSMGDTSAQSNIKTPLYFNTPVIPTTTTNTHSNAFGMENISHVLEKKRREHNLSKLRPIDPSLQTRQQQQQQQQSITHNAFQTNPMRNPFLSGVLEQNIQHQQSQHQQHNQGMKYHLDNNNNSSSNNMYWYAANQQQQSTPPPPPQSQWMYSESESSPPSPPPPNNMGSSSVFYNIPPSSSSSSQSLVSNTHDTTTPLVYNNTEGTNINKDDDEDNNNNNKIEKKSDEKKLHNIPKKTFVIILLGILILFSTLYIAIQLHRLNKRLALAAKHQQQLDNPSLKHVLNGGMNRKLSKWLVLWRKLNRFFKKPRHYTDDVDGDNEDIDDERYTYVQKNTLKTRSKPTNSQEQRNPKHIPIENQQNEYTYNNREHINSNSDDVDDGDADNEIISHNISTGIGYDDNIVKSDNITIQDNDKKSIGGMQQNRKPVPLNNKNIAPQITVEELFDLIDRGETFAIRFFKHRCNMCHETLPDYLDFARIVRSGINGLYSNRDTVPSGAEMKLKCYQINGEDALSSTRFQRRIMQYFKLESFPSVYLIVRGEMVQPKPVSTSLSFLSHYVKKNSNTVLSSS